MNVVARASALIDTTIFRLTDTMRVATQVRTIKWGTAEQTVEIVGMERKRQRDPWMDSQIEAMPTIARLASGGALRLCSYSEIDFELFKGSNSGLVGLTGDLFSGICVEDVPPAIERSHFEQIEIGEYVQKENVIDFCRFLLRVDHAIFEARPRFLYRFTDFERRNVKALDRFRELCRHLPEKHYPDALHFWTAETNGLDYFLTSDKKFINALTQSSRVPLVTKPIAPRDLVVAFGINVLDPLPIEDFGFHHLFD